MVHPFVPFTAKTKPPSWLLFTEVSHSDGGEVGSTPMIVTAGAQGPAAMEPDRFCGLHGQTLICHALCDGQVLVEISWGESWAAALTTLGL
jgi:hypothetical protein